MTDVELAERVIKLCPEVMGMNRVAEDVVRDWRIVGALMHKMQYLVIVKSGTLWFVNDIWDLVEAKGEACLPRSIIRFCVEYLDE